MMRLILLFATVLVAQSCHYSPDSFPNKQSEDFYKKAQEHQFDGKMEEALKFYDLAVQAAPNTAFILHERGLLKSNMDKYDEALEDLDKSIDMTTYQNDKEIRLSNRALTHMEMGNMDKACADWKRAGKWGDSYVDEYCK